MKKNEQSTAIWRRAMKLPTRQSVACGLHRACAFAAEDGCDAVQIFTKNSNQWREPRLEAEAVAAFREARAACPGGVRVMSHVSYLINLSAQDVTILDRSREALLREVQRCDTLGINDSRSPLGGRRDRHERIGQGEMGLLPF